MEKITAQEVSKRLRKIFDKGSLDLYQTVPREILRGRFFYEILSYLIHPLACKHQDHQCSCRQKREEFTLPSYVFMYNEMEASVANTDDFKNEIDLAFAKRSISIKAATKKVSQHNKDTLNKTRLLLELPSDRELRKRLIKCPSLEQIQNQLDLFSLDKKQKPGKASELHIVGYHTWKLLEKFHIEKKEPRLRHDIIETIQDEAFKENNGQFFRNRDEIERLMKTHHAMKAFITALFFCFQESERSKTPLNIFHCDFWERFFFYSLIFQAALLTLKRSHHKIKNPHTTENTVILPFNFVPVGQKKH